MHIAAVALPGVVAAAAAAAAAAGAAVAMFVLTVASFTYIPDLAAGHNPKANVATTSTDATRIL